MNLWLTMRRRPCGDESADELRQRALGVHADQESAADYARNRSPNGGWVGQYGGTWIQIDRSPDQVRTRAIEREEFQYAEERRRFAPVHERQGPRG